MAPAQPERVLLINSFGRESYDAFAAKFRGELLGRFQRRVDIFEVSLESARVSDLQEKSVLDYLESLFAGRRLDLVVPIGGPAVRFAQKNRARLFPGTPMLMAAVDQRHIRAASLTSNDTVVAVLNNPRRAIENILEVLPQTTNVALVIGNSPIEQIWLGILREEFRVFTNRLNVAWWNDLSFPEMLQRSAALPRNSAILFGILAVDAEGVSHVEERTLAELHAAANAPLFGLFSSQMGRGIVGGPLISMDELSRNAADVAARLLRGDAPAGIKTPPQQAGVPMFDWRELQRWGIRESALPRGSTVLFRQPTLWQQYRGRLIALGSFLIVQSVIISILVANLVKRRRAETKLRESDERMKMAADGANLGMWVWEVAEAGMWASDKWRAIHGYAPDADLRYDSLLERIHPEDRDVVERAVADAFNDGGVFHVQHRLLLPNGAVHWIATSGRLEENGDNGSLRMLGISIDISERKDAEEAAREVSGKLITAQEDERRRIARDLHDDLNQRLALLSVETDLLTRMDNDPPAQALITDIATRVRDLSSELHKLSYQLHPAKLYQLGLVAAVRSFCSEMSEQCGFKVEFVHRDVPRDVDEAVALSCYRIVQEALQNVLKHSGATRACVELRRHEDHVALTVSDNGHGFDMADIGRHAGLGLVGMRERARLVHGCIALQSAPGQGTRIEVAVPLSVGVNGAN